MLSPEQLQAAGDAVAAIYNDIEAKALDHMVEGLLNTDSIDQRTMTELGLLAQSQAPFIRNLLDERKDEIDEAVRETCERLLEASDKDDMRRVRGDQIFPMQIAATIDGVARILERDNLAMQEGARSAFLDASIEAVTRVNAGTMTRERALHHAVRKLESEGVPIITYRNTKTGMVTVRNKVDVAVRRHVRTQIAQDGADMTMQRMGRLGIDLVEVSSHEGSRPEHALWQGRCYSLSGDKTIDGVRYRDFYEATGYGSVSGLMGANCRHSFAPYRHGAPRAYEPDPKSPTGLSNDELYEYEQKQRALERDIREAKRQLRGAEIEHKALGTDESRVNLAKAKATLKNKQASMRKLIETTNAKAKPGTKVLTRRPYREWAGDMPKATTSASVKASTRMRKKAREELKQRCINCARPIFDRGDLGANARIAGGRLYRDGFYPIVAHGSPRTMVAFGQRIDAKLLAEIIKERADYKGQDIRLFSCSTGRADESGNCFAQRLADEMGCMVAAPNKTLWLSFDGSFTIGMQEDINDGEMVKFYPRNPK